MKDEISSEKIVINIDKGPFIKLSDICDSFEYIPLQTLEENLIGNIDKIIYSNHRFYIMDEEQSKCIMVFDRLGTFMFKIAALGKGPGEYISLDDFLINEEEQVIEILANSKIIKYDLDGRFISELRINLFVEKFERLNNGDYLFATSTPTSRTRYSLYLTNSQGNVLWKGFEWLNPNPNIDLLERKQFSKTSDYISVSFGYIDTVYHVYNDHLIRKVPIDFGGHNMPPDMFTRAPNYHSLLAQLKESIYVQHMDLITETKYFSYIFFLFEGMAYSAYTSKQSGNTKLYLHGRPTDLFFSSFPLTAIDDAYFVYPIQVGELVIALENISEEQIKKMADSKLWELCQHLDIESNPILMIAHLKEF